MLQQIMSGVARCAEYPVKYAAGNFIKQINITHSLLPILLTDNSHYCGFAKHRARPMARY